MPGLVARALDALDRGGSPALEAFLREHEPHAPTLRQDLDALRSAGFLDPPGGDSPPSQLGPFRLMSRIGGGGMGEVYLAEQVGLSRPVAVKLLRPEFLPFDGARERFRREVDALARMRHPGIVSVIAVGEEQGAPYLAMEWVCGATLQEVVAELSDRDPTTLRAADLGAAVQAVVDRRLSASLPTGEPPGAATSSEAARRLFSGTWVAACLRIVRQVAEALAHAHARGVLHRDIKPSNVMVTPDGRVLLLDFGLARPHGAESLTQAGTPLGSAAYMSSEQIRGDHGAVDERSDVYSLGVTLYELLTLRRAFAAESIESTYTQVTTGAFTPPRGRNPAVSRDAETVCLAAMDRDRARRYPTADALAQDAGNVLELRPIAARRPSAWLRVQRWSQRHSAAAVAIVAAVVFMVAGSVLWLVQQRQAHRRVEAALSETRAALEQVKRERDRTREAVDLLLTQVAEEQLLSAPRMLPLRHRLLESALRFEERMLEDAVGEAAETMHADVASAALRVGRLRYELGQSGLAAEALAKAEQSARIVVASAPPGAAGEERLRRVLAAKAEVLRASGRLSDALAAIDELLGLLPTSDERWDPARSLEQRAATRRRATILGQLGRTDEAIACYSQRALAPPEGEIDDAALRREMDREFLTGRANYASLLHALGRSSEALSVTAGALEASRSDASDFDVSTALLRARLLGIRAQAWERLGRLEDARVTAEQTLECVGGLLRDFPEVAEGRRIRAAANHILAMVCVAEGVVDDARERYELSIRELRELAANDHDALDVRQNLAIELVNLGALALESGEPSSARDCFQESTALAEAALSANPRRPGWDVTLFNSRWYLALALRDLGDHRAAIAAAERLAGESACDRRAGRIAAEIVLQCLPLVTQDPTLADVERARLRTEGRRRALDLLIGAAEAGCSDGDHVATHPLFAPLRDEPEFAAVVAAMRAAAASHGEP